MILHHVADRAGLVVERSPALDSKILGHGDLDALDITPLPEGLQEGVREPKKEHLIDGPLTEVMVDPKDRPLVESIEQRTVEGLRRGAVAAERLFDDHASAVGATRPAQLCHDRPEQRGRDREVVGRALGGAELLTNRIERRRGPVVAVDVAQLTGQLVERRGIESAVLLDAVARPGAELVEPPAGLRHADDRHVEVAAFRHRLQRWKDLLEREIARGPEEDQGVRMALAHRELRLGSTGFSRCHEAITLPRRHTSAMSRRSKSYWYCSGARSGVVSASTASARVPTLALRKMPSPSAYAAISPYSIPLCTILTKWPAPLAPQCR